MRALSKSKHGATAEDFSGGFFASANLARPAARRDFVNVNNSLSMLTGTLRGLHYQLGEAAEVKVVRCIRGSLWDAIIDLRPDSPSFGKWFGETLTAENRLMMYVPRGFAHAILTLEPETEALYLCANHYAPAEERGVRWNDPRFGVDWPLAPVEISPKDMNWPDFNEAFHQTERLRGLK